MSTTERSELAKKAWKKIRASWTPERRKQLATKRKRTAKFQAASERAKKAWATRKAS